MEPTRSPFVDHDRADDVIRRDTPSPSVRAIVSGLENMTPFNFHDSSGDINSAASSTFITHPEPHTSKEISDYTFNTEHDSRHGMDESMASFQQLLANLNINHAMNNSPVKLMTDLYAYREAQNNSETLSQTSKEISPPLPKICLLQTEEVPLLLSKDLKSLRNGQDYSIDSIDSRFDTRAQLDHDIDIDSSLERERIERLKQRLSPWKQLRAPSRTTERLPPVKFNGQPSSSSVSKVDELMKEVTGYKIQIKLFKQLLQKLVDSKVCDVDDIPRELAVSPTKSTHSRSLRLESEYHELSQSYDEIYKLNEDLFANLEQFEKQLQEKEAHMHELSDEVAAAHELLDDILAQNGLSGRGSLEDKLMSLRNVHTTDVQSAIHKLEAEVNRNKQDAARLAQDLRRESAECYHFKRNYELMHTKFNELCDSLGLEGELESLRRENARLQSINRRVDSKFEEYQNIIDSLQREVNEIRETPPQNTELQEEISIVNEELATLQQELEATTNRYKQLEEDSKLQIASLKAQVAASKTPSGMEQLLEAAVEKERKTQTEKIRLTYEVQALNSEKASLQNTIHRLTTKLENQPDTADSSRASDETLRRKLNFAEYQFDGLLLFDVYEFQKLLRSFNQIADDASLREPKKKIEELASSVNSHSSDKSSWTTAELNRAREHHKLVFNYFARAVELIVSDHVKLLLLENETHAQHKQQIERLQAQVDQLTTLDDTDSDINQTLSSPRLRMRIEELTNRWKAEREAREYESREAHRRLRELEEENERLRRGLPS